MSDSSSGAADQAGGNDQKKDSVSYDSFTKALNEKKKAQSEATELKARLDQYEQEKLETDGKLKEALDNSKKLNEQLKSEKATLAKTVTDKVLFSQFAREAEKLGCQDVKLAYSACDLSDVDVTQDLELDQKKLAEKLSSLAKDKSFLFKKDFKMPNDLTPGGTITSKPLSELTNAELLDQLRIANSKS